jgi:hypothetical protein
MKRYARMENDKVVEIIEIPGDGDIAKYFHPEIVAQLLLVDQLVESGMERQADGSFVLPPPPAKGWADIRRVRNGKLAGCDWTQLADAPLTLDQKAAWAAYRQALRDITQQADPNMIAWPVEP